MVKKKIADDDGWVFGGESEGAVADIGMLAGKSGKVHFHPIEELSIPGIQRAENDYLYKRAPIHIPNEKFNSLSEASHEFFFDQNLTALIPLEQLVQFKGEAWIKYTWKRNSMHSVVADQCHTYWASNDWLKHFSNCLTERHNSTRHLVDPSHPCSYNVGYVVDGIRVVTDALVMTSHSDDENLSCSFRTELGVNGVTAGNFSLSEALRFGNIELRHMTESYKILGDAVLFYHLRPVNWHFAWNLKHLFKPNLTELPSGGGSQKVVSPAKVSKDSDSDQECFEITDSSKLL